MSKIKLFYLVLLLPLSACVETTNFQVDRYQMDDLRDDDNDGVINQRDLCEQTPDLVAIDNNGCAFWGAVDDISWFVINFDFDRSVLNDSELPALEKARKQLQANKNINLVLIGDTSGEGSLMYNEALAKRRNNSVKEYLLRAGIDESRIELQLFDQPTAFTAHLKKRKRRTIAVFVDSQKVLTKEWNIYTTEEK
ncbi:MAG: OmpA family protein [Colwellia sp.]